MSVFLTPNLQPFFAGTYFPKPVFLRLLDQIATIWEEKRQDVIESAESILAQLRLAQAANNDTSAQFSRDALISSSTSLLHDLSQRFDSRYGGFSHRGPKFPSPSQTLNFLITFARALEGTGDENEELLRKKSAVSMCEKTFEGIWEGGVHDHVAGGIARYSVDERWHVPHFEKMLYDQGQLASSALSLSRLLPSLVDHSEDSVKMLQDMTSDILEYVERDLMDNGGAFWGAEDADSKESLEPVEGGKRVPIGKSLEGAFYVWTSAEIDEVLASDPGISELVEPTVASQIIKMRYGIKNDGNVDASSDIQGELNGKNVLYRDANIDSIARTSRLTKDEVETVIAASLKALKVWRDANRPRPHLDDKVVTSWNGLMISAYAKAHVMLPSSYQIHSRALPIVENAAKFIMRELTDIQTMELSRTWRDGARGSKGQADDYAFFIQALLDLYEASSKELYALKAIQLQEKQDELFWDKANGGWFNSRADEHILIRQKDPQDGAEPSAVSVTLSNLIRLSHIDTCRYEHYNKRIDRTIASIAPLLERTPRAVANSLLALIQREAGYRQFIVSGSRRSETVKTYIELIHKTRSLRGMDIILIHLDPDNLPKGLSERNEALKGLVEDIEKRKLEGKDVPEDVRLCTGFTCQLPVSSVKDVEKLVTGN